MELRRKKVSIYGCLGEGEGNGFSVLQRQHVLGKKLVGKEVGGERQGLVKEREPLGPL